MRRLFISMTLCSLLAVLAACSGKPEPKEARAVVKSMTDSTLVANVDGEEATLVAKDVRMVNGAYMPGDSVVLHYVGSLSSGEARALVVVLIPRPSEIIEGGVDESRELKTADISAEQELPEPEQTEE